MQRKKNNEFGGEGEIDWLLVFTVISKSITRLLRPFGNENMELFFCFLFVSYYFNFKDARVPRMSPG